ncbi:hypothetical protein ACOJUY_004289 [Vibrio alginolyticus]
MKGTCSNIDIPPSNRELDHVIVVFVLGIALGAALVLAYFYFSDGSPLLAREAAFEHMADLLVQNARACSTEGNL